MEILIVLVAWMICAFYMYSNYMAEIELIDADFSKIIVYVIFILGGPVLVINCLLIQILDKFMPEGWDDNDGFDK